MIGLMARLVITAVFCLSCIPASGQLSRSTIEQLQRATVRVSVAGGGVCSGVFITPRGHILTASHGVPADVREVRLQMAGNRHGTALLLARDADSDAALLQLQSTEQPGTLNSADAPPAWVPIATAPASPNEMLVALGCPAREPSGGSPSIRLGAVRAADPEVLRTTCMLTVGDSGGPLINRLGQLAGLHRQIGAGREANLHVGPGSLRDLLRKAGVQPPLQAPSVSPLWPETQQWQASPQTLSQLARSTVEILTLTTAAELRCVGTRLDRRFIAVKLSLLKPAESLQGRFSDGSMRQLKLVHANPQLDIAVLENAVEAPLPPPPEMLPMAIAEAGEIVFAVCGLDLKTGLCRISGPGVITRTNHSEPPATPRIGMLLEEQSGESGLRVREAAPNGPAAVAGLQSGDLLLTLSGHPVRTLSELGTEVLRHQPGDWLTLELLRSGKNLTTDLQAGHDPATTFDRLEYLDGRAGALSVRRTGFKAVLQHDIPLQPSECGGLLISVDGRAVGWNIARRARESSLGLPLQVLIEEFSTAAEIARE